MTPLKRELYAYAIKIRKAHRFFNPAIWPYFSPIMKALPIRHSSFIVQLTFLGFEIIFLFNPNQKKCQEKKVEESKGQKVE